LRCHTPRFDSNISILLSIREPSIRGDPIRHLASVAHGIVHMPNYHPQTREEYLAQELAERLEDPQGLPLYLKVARRYTESSIRQILGRVMEVPDERIRTSRGALFNWLIHRHGKRLNPTDPAADARP
jgi:hypothetical protein